MAEFIDYIQELKTIDPAYLSVIVVDDNHGISMGLKFLLEEMGFQKTNISVFDVAQKAAEALGKNSYDLMITDHHIPSNSEGLALARHRNRPKACIMYSGSSSVPGLPDDVELMRKPANLNTIEACINKVLARAQSRAK